MYRTLCDAIHSSCDTVPCTRKALAALLCGDSKQESCPSSSRRWQLNIPAILLAAVCYNNCHNGCYIPLLTSGPSDACRRDNPTPPGSTQQGSRHGLSGGDVRIFSL